VRALVADLVESLVQLEEVEEREERLTIGRKEASLV
jgi:hypothetical protein